MKLKSLLFGTALGIISLFPLKLKAQEYDSLKTMQVARNLENYDFNLKGYLLNKPLQIQIDHNDSSVVINCPLIAEKQHNNSLMIYPIFIAFNKNDSANRANKDFINRYGGVGFILDNNSISPLTYADSIKRLLKPITTSVGNFDDKSLENKLYDIYPNPSNGMINIEYELKNSANLVFNLYDILGRQVKTLSEDAIPGKYKQTFNTSGLPSGAYFIRIVIDSDKKRQVSTKRINIIK